MRIHNRGQPRQWDPFVFDNIEYKNIKKKPYVKLSMTITEDMHPASPVPHLLFKVGNTPLEILPTTNILRQILLENIHLPLLNREASRNKSTMLKKNFNGSSILQMKNIGNSKNSKNNTRRK